MSVAFQAKSLPNLLSDFVGVDPVVRLNNRLILNSDGLAEVVVVLHDDHVVVVVLDELDVEQLERLNKIWMILGEKTFLDRMFQWL